ncbi:amidohydrolase [Anaerovorax odorimutans]|uniref:Amidohydrolase n=1 Tax=Anaerovorax odorimutans TaxID=109327 RepID=A0ABT1RP00_9FIRM|nr:amidohydrolase [Anaerovorax odorimutans]MCQ4636905.1 amidohydrolase [Anaerovorax odorimutans]
MICADILIESRAVFTGTEREPFNGWVAVKENRIQAVGKGAVPEGLVGRETKQYQYGDQLVMAGFIDSHIHFGLGSAFKSKHYVDLAPAKSEEACIELIREHLAENPNIDHVLGWGWFLVNWDDPTPPSRDSLDAQFPDIPLYLFCVDGHTCWLNTKAMEVCGIREDQKLSFGSFGKDENGRLTGLLYEVDALSFVMDRAFAVADDDWPAVRDRMLGYIAGCGITSVGDLSASPRLNEEPELYGKLLDAREEGRLTARIHLYPSLGESTDFHVARAIREKYQFDDLKFSGLKQFVDGTTSLYSGCLLEDYADRPGEKGFSNYPPEKYKELITAANKEGWGVRLHSIGDGAVRIALDAIEESGKTNDLSVLKNCVEHCESVNPLDIPRFAQLGAFASIQPTHLPLDMNEKVERIGKERARYEWPTASLLKSGAPLCFGSDYPVYEMNPMIGIHAAVTRCLTDGTPTGVNPQERISLTDALLAYTKGSAESLGREQELGTLEEGKLADLVVLDSNLFGMELQDYLKVRPLLTMMDGKVVYEGEI